MNDIVRFHVPCKKEYTRLVEEVAAQVGVYLTSKVSAQFIQKIRAVMNELFMNIVNHSDTAEKQEVVRFQFEIGQEYFTTSIYDYGSGFAADGYHPPYPEQVVGRTYKLRDVLDGSVHFKVVDPFTLTFSFIEKESSEMELVDEFALLDDHGLGISIITKIMDNVSYSYLGNGKYDWKLVKKLEEA